MTPVCRFCESPLKNTLVDLGMSPLSNSYLRAEQLTQMEPFYPLHVYVCNTCFLVQLEDLETPEVIFGDYAYFSSYADSWLKHARDYTDYAIERFRIDGSSRVIEIASNDGYLLRYFKEKGVSILGIEPARNVAQIAIDSGIPTLVKFFGADVAKGTASEYGRADLLIGNNVLAHVPDLNDFVAGLQILLSPEGVLTMEFPHLLRLLENTQFDTIYHEHFSYFSFLTVERVLARHGLVVFDVDELPTHGGSLRIFARQSGDGAKSVSQQVQALKETERQAGLEELSGYAGFEARAQQIKRDLLEFLIKAKRAGQSIVGYGAPAKGNTLLNYCGIRTDLVDYTVDRSPHKQNLFLPGVRLPVFAPEKIRETRPDYVLILPWNLRTEIMEQMSFVRSWGGRFVTPIPCVEVFD